MRTGTRKRSTSKQKKSYTLSRSSVTFLERLRKETAAPSISFLLDGIIRDAEEQRKRQSIGRAFTEYYDTLTDEELRESREWGDYSTSVLRGTRE